MAAIPTEDIKAVSLLITFWKARALIGAVTLAGVGFAWLWRR
jgi:hypothetical protein